MSIIYHERPGVYSDYTTSKVTATSAALKTVALIGSSPAQKGLYTVTGSTSAREQFGADSVLGNMISAAIYNGAGNILAYSLAEETEDAWREAISAVLAEKEAAFCAVGSTDLAVQQMLKEAVVSASMQKAECLGVVVSEDASVEALTQRAAALDCERMVLVGPDCYFAGETTLAGVSVAAAVCGLLSCQQDPALPLNGAVLQGFDGVSARYEETEIDNLVRNGVTVLEGVGGQVQILRGITTKKTQGEGCDTTYRELSTVLIIDDVIPGIRRALAARFPRAKNNAVTRSAIRSQVIVELESRVRREIIDGYENVQVEASSTDASVCLVTFGFTVTHGLNRILLTAHISV